MALWLQLPEWKNLVSEAGEKKTTARRQEFDSI